MKKVMFYGLYNLTLVLVAILVPEDRKCVRWYT